LFDCAAAPVWFAALFAAVVVAAVADAAVAAAAVTAAVALLAVALLSIVLAFVASPVATGFVPFAAVPFGCAEPDEAGAGFAGGAAPFAVLEFVFVAGAVLVLPFAAAGLDVCCAACGGLAGEGGGFAGADALASSKVANGCESVSWLGCEGCARDDWEYEAAAVTSDAILGTGELPKAT
jgi:hypothetical protein